MYVRKVGMITYKIAAKFWDSFMPCEAVAYNQMAESDVDVSEGLGCVIKGCESCRESCDSETGARS